MNMFNVIQPLLKNLATVSVEGWLHNGGMQDWYIVPDGKPAEYHRNIKDIKTRLHSFLLNQGRSPSKRFRILDGDYDFLRPQYDSAVDAGYLQLPRVKGDSRFQVSYDHAESPLYKSDGEEDDDAELIQPSTRDFDDEFSDEEFLNSDDGL